MIYINDGLILLCNGRIASRNSRLTLLRVTALPTFLETERPIFKPSPDLAESNSKWREADFSPRL